MTVETPVRIGDELTPAAVTAVAREDAQVVITDDARERVRKSRKRVESVIDSEETVYGINTGFGELVTECISPDDLQALQTNLVRSHASGTGEPIHRAGVRAMMVSRLQALALGYSGVREIVLDHLATMLNEGVHPVVRSRGSLGASGDLAPLAALALVLIGEGQARVDDLDAEAAVTVEGDPDVDVDGEVDGDNVIYGQAALSAVGLEPLELAPKEGLALINGTQLTAGLAALACEDATAIVNAADAAGALTTEVSMGSTVASSEAIASVRPHPGHRVSARNVRRLTADSGIVESHRNCDRVQDAYSIRCLPQVHGATREALAHLREAVTVELNSATDNPLIFDPEAVDQPTSQTDSAAVVSGGNFHGVALAHRIDYLARVLTDVAVMSERRVDRLLNPNVQEPHLTPFLARESGLESGMMIAQYTAASLVAECRQVGTAGTDSIPVSGNQEDHVSMSATAAFGLETVVDAVRRCIAIELLCGAEAAEYVEDELDHGVGTQVVYDVVREVVDPLETDRPLAPDIDAIAGVIRDNTLQTAVEAVLEDGFAGLDVME